MSFTIYNSDFSDSITCPQFKFGDSAEFALGQEVVDLTDGHMAAIDRGTRTRTVSGLITGMTNDEMHNFKDFMLDTIQGSLNTFFLEWDNKRDGETWNPHKQMLYVGATVGGAALVADGTYNASQKVAVDKILIGPLRLKSPRLKFIERPGRGGGTYEVSITATIEDDSERP
jgi:hypothetical protein